MKYIFEKTKLLLDDRALVSKLLCCKLWQSTYWDSEKTHRRTELSGKLTHALYHRPEGPCFTALLDKPFCIGAKLALVGDVVFCLELVQPLYFHYNNTGYSNWCFYSEERYEVLQSDRWVKSLPNTWSACRARRHYDGLYWPKAYWQDIINTWVL